MRSRKGITLVSLVVTIIVLIILAGVSINLTLGENGIITMAKKARENMELAQIEEKSQLNDLYEQIQLEGSSTGGADYDLASKFIEFKQKVASAITDMGIETLETANADTMASNIRKISTNSDAESISYNNTNSGLTAENVQEAVDELSGSLVAFPDLSNVIEEYTELGTYTIPSDGYFIGRIAMKSTGVTTKIELNGVRICSASGVNDNYNNIGSVTIPVKKGMTLEISASGSKNNAFVEAYLFGFCK